MAKELSNERDPFCDLRIRNRIINDNVQELSTEHRDVRMPSTSKNNEDNRAPEYHTPRISKQVL